MHFTKSENMDFILKLIVFDLLVFCSINIKVFSQTNDNFLWTGLEINLPVTKNVDLSFNPELRSFIDLDTIDWMISDLGLSYKINKDFKIAIGYNYRSKLNAWQHVFNFSGYYDNKIWNFKYKYRLRYQKKLKHKFEWNNENVKRIEESFEDHIRNKIILEYDTDMWFRPFTGFELYYLIGHESFPKKIKQQGPDPVITYKYSDRFDIYRTYIGLNFDTFKYQKLSIYWMYEEEFNIEKPKISRVIGIFYSIDLPILF